LGLAGCFQPVHDFGDTLGAVARADEQGVRRFDDNQIPDADCGEEFFRGPQKKLP